VPPHQVTQADVCAWVGDSLVASPAQRCWLNRMYTLSGIETRHQRLVLATRGPQRALVEHEHRAFHRTAR
jgi:hypothetical protein